MHRSARDAGPGAAGDYYHDTRGGKITMSGPSAMQAWRGASASATAAANATNEGNNRPHTPQHHAARSSVPPHGQAGA